MSDSPVQKLGRRILERRVVPWTLAYVAGAWVAVEMTGYLSDMFGWSELVAEYLVYILGFGTLAAITIAWFHGEQGWQRVTRREVTVHGLIAVALLATLVMSPPQLDEATGPTVAMELPATRVAILYYKDHTADQSLTSLAADLTEQVTHRLAQVPALDVRPLAAVEPFRSAPVALDSVIRALQAGSLVEGSVSKQDGQIVVTTQLFDGRSQGHLGSWVITRPDTVAALVTELADSVAFAIRTTIGQHVREELVRASTDVPEALTRYERAQAILDNEAGPAWREDRERGVELLDEADRLLAEAERLDPDWIEPTVARLDLAETKAQLMGGAGTMDTAILHTAIDHASRALALTEDSAPLLERRGILRTSLADYSDAETANRLRSEAERDLRQAARLDPDRAATWWGLSQLMAYRGSTAESYRFAQDAYAADSFREMSAALLERLCMSALNLKRFDDATRWCLEGRRLMPMDQGPAYNYLAVLASLPDPGPEEIEQAWAYADTVAALAMGDRKKSWRGYGEALVAVTLATAGYADSARAVLSRAQQTLERAAEPPMQAAGDLFEAVALLRLGEYEAVFSALEDYVEQYPGRAERLRDEWWFEELWDDPRFIQLYGGTPTEALGRS